MIFSQRPCWLSWIALEDLVRMIVWAVSHSQVKGVYNAVSPHAVSLSEFYNILARQIQSKSLPLPAPLFLMRLLGGEMIKNLLVSCKAFPEKAIQQGFVFKKADLAATLK